MIRKKITHLSRFTVLCCAGITGLLSQQQAIAQTSLPTHDSIGATGSVTFTYQNAQVTYTIIRAGDSSIWLQQNLGSSQVATAQNDANSYGDLFQWGRWDDGGQLRTSTAAQATTLSANNPSGLGSGLANHITNNGGTVWWSGANTSLDNTWSADPPSATNGLDPCVALGIGWRMPDSANWARVRAATAENITSVATAYSSRLKLPAAGYRNTANANVTSAGTAGLYASKSNTTSTNVNSPVQPWYLYNGALSNIWQRGNGASCRCVYIPLCNGTPDGGKMSTSRRSVCNGDGFTLSLTIPELTNIAYQWQERPVGASDFIDIPSAGKTFLHVANHQRTTEYRCKVTCTSSMDSSYSDTLAVAILSLPIELGKDTTICDGETITFDAGIGGTDYEWSNGMTSRTITVSDPDVYWARISNSAGCIGSDTIAVSFLGTPSATAINAAAYGLTYAFSVANALDATSYEWTFGDGGNGNGANPIHTYDTSGTYDVAVVLRNACDSATINRQVTVVAPTTGISSSGENGHIKIYPVPARDVLHINADAAMRIDDVHVFDINGRQLVRTGKPAAKEIQINTTAWPSGIYLIKILSDKGSEMHRVIVE